VQIGANDGITDDPLYLYIKNENWRALLVEPRSDVFEARLKVNYRNVPDVFFENVALGELPFYRLSFTKEKWATGLASFVKDCLEAHIKNGYIANKARDDEVALPEKEADWIEEVMVKVDNFTNILKRNDFRRVDLLCVDTEGFDYQILKMFDFKNRTPELILFESKNLSDGDFIKAQEFLKGFGCRLFWQKGNVLALQFEMPWAKKFFLRAKALIQKI
jgi:FkbM family methyltransferase